MEEQEYKVLVYLNERINGNEDAVYLSAVEEQYEMNEIGYYTEKLIDKGYIIPRTKEWKLENGRIESIYNNSCRFVNYEWLELSEKAEMYIKYKNMNAIQKLLFKLKGESKEFGKSMYDETKKGLSKWISGIIIGSILLAGSIIVSTVTKYF